MVFKNIGPRLYISFAIFLMPLIYLAYSLIASQSIEIDSVNKEMTGNRYISIIREVHYALVGLSPKGPSLTDAIRQAELEYGSLLDTAGDVDKVIDDSARGGNARKSLRELISKISDTSNLILDPDLDSYYVMHIAVVVIPDLTDRIFDIAHLADTIAAKDALVADDKAEYLIRKGGLQTTLADLGFDLAHAYKGNPDSGLRSRLDSRHAKLADLAARLLMAYDAVVLGKTGVSDSPAVTSLGRETLLALQDIDGTAGAELERLLAKRVDGFMADRATKLGVSLGLFIVAFVFGCVQVVRGVVWPLEAMISAMISAMTRLAGGHTETGIPGMDRRDEIGRMAAAVQVFNRINQMLVRTMLEKFDHSVEVVENGRQALAAVATGDFDAVLMDMPMPEMDGEEATSAIRDLPPPKNRLPVLALTADVMTEHRERYLQAGVDDLIAKPIDWDILSAALMAHTRAGRGGPGMAGNRHLSEGGA